MDLTIKKKRKKERFEANCESVYWTEFSADRLLLDAFVSTLGAIRLLKLVTLVTGLTFLVLCDRPEEMLPTLEVFSSVPNSRGLRVPPWYYV